MSNNQLREQVIEDIVVRLTLDGAFPHGYIYAKSLVTVHEKKVFRRVIAKTLADTLNNILSKADYNDENHYLTIQEFSVTISNKYGKILNDGRLRIGVAQKLVNLYWKYSWLLKKDIRRPIHCPFDRFVIGMLPGMTNKISWTGTDDINDYKALVDACYRMVAGHNPETSIAEWELKEYYSKVNYSQSDSTGKNEKLI